MGNSATAFEMNTFKKQLIETVIWCRYKLSLSPNKAPLETLWSLIERLPKPQARRQSIILMDNNQRVEFTETLFKTRASLVGGISQRPDITLDRNLAGGRLLA